MRNLLIHERTGVKPWLLHIRTQLRASVKEEGFLANHMGQTDYISDLAYIPYIHYRIPYSGLVDVAQERIVRDSILELLPHSSTFNKW